MTTTDIPVPPTAPAVAPVPAAATTTPGLSIAALITGIVGIIGGFWFAGIAAIVLGFMARTREPQARTMSTWGIVLGFVGTFGWVIAAVVGLAFAAPFLAFAPFWF
jgi:F0F1-type ATP synthase membrane subunit c/vacuolar-type H+-ATPase subunit K